MRYLISVTLAAALIVGCGGVPSAPSSPGAGAPQEPVQPVVRAPEGTGPAGGVCYLVTDAEVGAVMGRQPMSGGGSGFELGGIGYCNWLLYMDPMEAVSIQLSRAVNHEEGRIFDHEPVPRLGENAYWVTAENLEGLYVRQGQYSLYVSVTSESSDLKTAATAVARAALARLPR